MFEKIRKKDREWDEWFIKELEEDYLNNILIKLAKDKEDYIIYPANFLRVFSYPKSEVKVVLIGDNPYHNPLEADGLAFSAKELEQPPLALENIYRKIENELKYKCDYSQNDLDKWAKQGVMLLNINLTTRAGVKNSHSFLRWRSFTSKVLEELFLDNKPKVFISLSHQAHEILNFLIYRYGTFNHLILYGDSPSSRFFFRVSYFKKTNDFLKEHYNIEIDWT